jgi:hypothetical protein
MIPIPVQLALLQYPPVSLSHSNPVIRTQSVGERQWSEDQLRWEAQLAKLAARVQTKTATFPRLAPARSTLELASAGTPRDALLIPRLLPAMTGTEPEELLCGGCSGILGAGISARNARRRHPEGQRLLIRCPCGALNLLARDRGCRS